MGKPLDPFTNPISIDAGTSARVANAPPGPAGTTLVPPGSGISAGKGLSYELKDAPAMSIPIPLGNVSEDEARAFAWIYEHRAEIIAAELEFRVDRRAIAGAVAWEALENAGFAGGVRAQGPAKVHSFKLNVGNVGYGENETIAKQIEDLGYIAKQANVGDRTEVLKTPAGSMRYVGAIMAAFIDISAKHGYNIRCDPVVLTHCFQGPGSKFSKQGDLDNWDKLLAAKKGAPLAPGNDMALWVKAHLALIEQVVGGPGIPCG